MQPIKLKPIFAGLNLTLKCFTEAARLSKTTPAVMRSAHLFHHWSPLWQVQLVWTSQVKGERG